MIDFEVHPIGTGRLLSEAVDDFRNEMNDGRGTPTDGHGIVKVEIDGERLAGVVSAVFEKDADGDYCLMLFTDPILAAHVAGGTGVGLPLSLHTSLSHD